MCIVFESKFVQYYKPHDNIENRVGRGVCRKPLVAPVSPFSSEKFKKALYVLEEVNEKTWIDTNV